MNPASRRSAWKRVLASPAARVAATALGLLYLAVLFAPRLTPFDPRHAREHESHVPPNVSFVDASGRVRLWPVVHALERREDDLGARRWTPVPGGDVSWRPFASADAGNEPAPHLLGTDLRGRDLLARILHGGRVSLTIGLVGVLVSFAIGMVVGGIAGWFGGRVDEALMRLCELLMLLPAFYVLLALRGSLPDTSRWSSARVYATVVAIVSALWWAGLARAIRGQVLAIKAREYVLAARALGAGATRIVLRHLLPGTLPFALVAAALAIPGYVLMESGLSMLGLGIQEPEPSWGNLLAEATRVSQIAEHPWMLAPGVFLCVAVAAFNVLGEALRTALDPHTSAVA